MLEQDIKIMALVSRHTLEVIVTAVFFCDVICASTGIKMCEHLCLNTAGCWDYIFTTSDLSCDITRNVYLELKPETLLFNVKMKTRGIEQGCVMDSTIIKKRDGHYKCIKSKQSETRKQVLFFLERGIDTNTLHGYFPVDKSLKTWKLDNNKDVYVFMVYNHPAGVVLYTKTHILKLFLMDEGFVNEAGVREKSRPITDLTSGSNCIYYIRNERQFRSRRRDRNIGYFKMQKKGIVHFTDVFTNVGDCTHIAFYKVTTSLFAICKGRINEYLIKDKKVKMFMYHAYTHRLVVDNMHHIMYTVSGTRVEARDLLRKSKHPITDTDFQIFQFSYFQGSLFMSSRDKSPCTVYEYRNNVLTNITAIGKSHLLIA